MDGMFQAMAVRKIRVTVLSSRAHIHPGVWGSDGGMGCCALSAAFTIASSPGLATLSTQVSKPAGQLEHASQQASEDREGMKL